MAEFNGGIVARCELLERRSLLSSSVPVITDIGGVVDIQGTSGNDVVTLSVANSKLKIHVNAVSQAIPLSEVQGIEISLLAGNDSLTLNSGVPLVTAEGNAGNDTIVALNVGKNHIEGGIGHDSIVGGGGRELLDGGAGPDTIIAGNGQDTLTGDDGNDSMVAGTGKSILDGGNQNDTLVASLTDDAGSSTLKGNAGNDILNGTGGHESLTGGADNDTLTGGIQGISFDTLSGGAGNDSIKPGSEDTIVGVDSGDTIATAIPD